MAAVGFRSIGRSLAGGFLDRKSKDKKLAEEQREEMRAQYEAAMSQGARKSSENDI